jgi:thioredoxin
MSIIELRNNQLDSFLENNKICVFDFYANWCGPCKILSPILEKLSNAFTNISFAKINVDSENELTQKFNIRSIPTLMFFKNGKLINQLTGFRTEQEMHDILKHLL